MWTPRVLKDGSDSVGALGALNRVYINIGLFSEEWLPHFNAVVGGKPITPIQIEIAQENSTYWRATESARPRPRCSSSRPRSPTTWPMRRAAQAT